VRECAKRLPPNTNAYGTAELKDSGWRKRTINNTYGENTLSRNAADGPSRPPHRVAPIHIMIKRMTRHRFGAGRDMKSFYNQFAVKPDRFTFDTAKGQSLSLTRMAMGHVDAALIAHTTCLAILLLAIQRALMTHKGSVAYDVIIDDACFTASTRELCVAIETHFDTICTEYNFTVGRKNATASIISHRGVDIDLNTRNITARKAFIDKHAARLPILRKSPTAARCRSAVGTLVYHATMSPAVRNTIPMLLKAVASLMRETTSTNLKAVGTILADAYTEMLRNDPWTVTDVSHEQYSGYVIADATPTAFGGIFVDIMGHEACIKGRFVEELPIHLAEAFATIATTQALVPTAHYVRKIIFATDNMAWFHTATKPWSMNEEMDAARREFASTLLQRNVLPTMMYIASASMPADEVSRGRL
jgi:hypothetical protein